MKTIFKSFAVLLTLSFMVTGCGPGDQKSSNQGALTGNAAEKVYIAPGEHDSHYAFLSGGFSGQLAVYGLPSGRLFRVIPVFSQDPEKGYGYNEETKPMLMTSHGFIPWISPVWPWGFPVGERPCFLFLCLSLLEEPMFPILNFSGLPISF